MSRFALLADLNNETSSESRREILRKVTETMEVTHMGDGEMAEFDQLLSKISSDYSTQIRADLAKLIVGGNSLFACSAQIFAMDEKIEVAGPVLKHSRVLTEDTLLKVIEHRGDDHMLAVTERPDIGHKVSHALVERGSDTVVEKLLANDKAAIAPHTFEVVAKRAETSTQLQSPIVKRKDVPLDMLNDMYLKVEGKLRREILEKFSHVPAEDVEKAFRRSRGRLAAELGGTPPDMAAAKIRLAAMAKQNQLEPPVLVTLLRQGPASRTAFLLAFANMVDVEFDLVQRSVDKKDIDTMALLCRGASFPRGLFVSLAIALGGDDKGLAAAEQFAALYESVPVVAAQRALRFWKVRHAA